MGSRSAEKFEYLREHLPYEMLMLKYTHRNIHRTRRRLDWNAYFESYFVHARNLYHFLTNERDSRNFKANDFVSGFSIEKPPDAVGIFLKSHAQLFHLAKIRTSDPTKKLLLTDADESKHWIDENFSSFIKKLDEPFRSYWKPELSQLQEPDAIYLNVGSAQTTATNHIEVTTTSSNLGTTFSGTGPTNTKS